MSMSEPPPSPPSFPLNSTYAPALPAFSIFFSSDSGFDSTRVLVRSVSIDHFFSPFSFFLSIELNSGAVMSSSPFRPSQQGSSSPPPPRKTCREPLITLFLPPPLFYHAQKFFFFLFSIDLLEPHVNRTTSNPFSLLFPLSLWDLSSPPLPSEYTHFFFLSFDRASQLALELASRTLSL